MKELFPELKFEFTLEDQLDVIAGELQEARDAEGREHFLSEVLDVMQASAQLLYNQYSSAEIEQGLKDLYDRHEKRGYLK